MEGDYIMPRRPARREARAARRPRRRIRRPMRRPCRRDCRRSMPTVCASAKAAPAKSDDGLPELGLELAPSGEGEGVAVAVAAVDSDGPAAQKGVKEGDVILEV